MKSCQEPDPGAAAATAQFEAFYALRFVTQLTTRSQMSLFSAVEMAPRDPILGLNEAFNADTRATKVNLGVGVYFTDEGKIPLLRAVQEAEKARSEEHTSELQSH